MKKSCLLVLFFFFLSLSAGCASLIFQSADVSFEDPYKRLDIRPAEPLPEELQGVTLRLLAPESGTEQSKEEAVVFISVKEGRGNKAVLKQTHTDHFLAGSRPDSYVVKSETQFEGEGGTVTEESELSTRGEIIKFISGEHKSRIGKVKISSRTRTPVFPEAPVKTGGTWTYDEVMDLRLDSMFIKQKNPAPCTVHATSKLDGFATVKGVRCAVVRTTATQFQQTDLKVLFKELLLDTNSEIEELAFVDYKKGRVLARVTKTKDLTSSAKLGIQESSLSQSIFFTAD